MSDNKKVAEITIYYNPNSKVYTAELYDENSVVVDSVHGDITAIGDWLFSISLTLPDIVEVQ